MPDPPRLRADPSSGLGTEGFIPRIAERTPDSPPDERTYEIWVCPECGDQNTRDRKWLGPATTYCQNHEGEDRKLRPAHVPITVRPADQPRPEDRQRVEHLEHWLRSIRATASVWQGTKSTTALSRVLSHAETALSPASEERDG